MTDHTAGQREPSAPSRGSVANHDARLAALEELVALDQKLELEYGLTGNPMIKAQEHMRSQNCCYCEKPHGKSFPLIFQSCDACQDARDKRAIDASNGLISVSCPRCDLQFSADATHSLTDEEREAIKWAAVVSEGLCQMGAMNRARTLLGILERLKWPQNTEDQEHRMTDSTTPQDAAAMSPASDGSVAGKPVAWIAVFDGYDADGEFVWPDKARAIEWASTRPRVQIAPLYLRPQIAVVRLPPLDPNGAPGWNAAIGAVREALAEARVDWDTD